MQATTPADEAERLRILHALGVLGALPEESFDRVTRLARRLFSVDGCAIVLIDHQHEILLSQHGKPLQPHPRSSSITAHVLSNNQALFVEDTTLDLRFHAHPDVLGPASVRFFAAHPLQVDGGHTLGALVLFDAEPRCLDEEEQDLLADLAERVVAELSTSLAVELDPITGLNSVRSFIGIAEFAMASGIRNQSPTTLLHFDIDGFRSINERYGRAAGDEALLETATLLKACFRGVDLLARLNGDSFCVLLTGATPEQADVPLQRLAALVREANELRTEEWNLSFAVGYAGYDPLEHPNVSALVADAINGSYDLALGQTA